MLSLSALGTHTFAISSEYSSTMIAKRRFRGVFVGDRANKLPISFTTRTAPFLSASAVNQVNEHNWNSGAYCEIRKFATRLVLGQSESFIRIDYCCSAAFTGSFAEVHLWRC